MQINQLNKQISQKTLPNLNIGDVILAEITEIDGQNVTLKSHEDAILIARLLSNMNLKLGDNIELMVSSKEGDRYVMQNLSVESGVIDNTVSQKPTTYASEGKVHSAIISTLKNLGVVQSPQLVDKIINIMSEHQDVNIKSAVFLALNDIPVSEENINLLRELTGNENIGKELFEIINQVVNNQRAPIDAHVAQPSNNPIQTQSEVLPIPNNTNDMVASNIADTASGAANEENTILNTVTQVVQPNEGIVDNDINNIQNSEQTQAAKPNLPLEQSDILVYNDKEGELVDLKQQYTTKDVIQKVLSMFVSLEEIKEDETKIKEAGKDLNQKLSDLKEIIKNSDIRNRENIVAKTDNIISKNKMASDINRFTYMQIPINLNSEQKTAELFVYNRKKTKKQLDPNDIIMLIGLDTTNLGRVETAIKVQNKNVSLKICGENASAIDILKKRSVGLKKVLGEIGYLLSDVKVERLFEKTTVVNAEEVLLRADQKSSTIVDYKI
jgi:hypothetical protein